MKPALIVVPVASLVSAKWNYKTEGTEEQIAKLVESIKHDESAGVPAVRDLGDGKYEVIDGNHRLAAINRLGWFECTVENFGKLSKAASILISRRRNKIWFDDDVLKLAELFRTDVAKEFTPEDMAKFMPETQAELEALMNLGDYDFSKLNEENARLEGSEDAKISILVPFKYAQEIITWLSNGEGEAPRALGRGVMKRCGLL